MRAYVCEADLLVNPSSMNLFNVSSDLSSSSEPPSLLPSFFIEIHSQVPSLQSISNLSFDFLKSISNYFLVFIKICVIIISLKARKL